jgi:hypothetical protein
MTGNSWEANILVSPSRGELRYVDQHVGKNCVVNLVEKYDWNGLLVYRLCEVPPRNMPNFRRRPRRSYNGLIDHVLFIYIPLHEPQKYSREMYTILDLIRAGGGWRVSDKIMWIGWEK